MNSRRLKSYILVFILMFIFIVPVYADDFEYDIYKDFNSLTESEENEVYLIIRNTSNEPITIETLTLTLQAVKDQNELVNDNIEKDYAIIREVNQIIAVGSEELYNMTIKIDDEISPGKYNGFIQVGYSFSEKESMNKIIQFEVELGIVIENDLLEVLELPSLFLVPGFIIISLMSFMLKKLNVIKEELFKVKSVEFWIGLFTITFLIIIIEDKIQWSLTLGKTYSTVSIAYSWMMSFVLGGFLSGLIAGIYYLVKHVKYKFNEKKMSLIVKPNDHAKTVLEKLLKKKIHLELESVKKDNKRYCYYENDDPKKSKVLISPIKIEAVYEDDEEALYDLYEKGYLAQILELLMEGKIRTSFNVKPSESGVQKIETATIEQEKIKYMFVE